MTNSEKGLPVIPPRPVVAVCGECGDKIYAGQEWPCQNRACPVCPDTMRWYRIQELDDARRAKLTEERKR